MECVWSGWWGNELGSGQALLGRGTSEESRKDSWAGLRGPVKPKDVKAAHEIYRPYNTFVLWLVSSAWNTAGPQ